MRRHTVQRQRIGPAIRRFRQERGQTLEQLATDAGISASHLSRLERSQTLPSFTVLAKIAQALGANVDEFVQLEKHVTVLDAEFDHYLRLLGLDPHIHSELLGISIEARQSLVERIRTLSEAALTPVAVQEEAVRALSEQGVPGASTRLSHLIERAGLTGVPFTRALRRLLETPGRRIGVISGQSFLFVPHDASFVNAYRTVFGDAPLPPSIATWWETSEPLRQEMRHGWPARFIVHRSVLEMVREGRPGPGGDVPAKQTARHSATSWADHLESTPELEVGVTERDLGVVNYMTRGESACLVECVRSHEATSASARAGLWLSGRELVTTLTEQAAQLWDELPAENKDRHRIASWLRGESSASA